VPVVKCLIFLMDQFIFYQSSPKDQRVFFIGCNYLLHNIVTIQLLNIAYCLITRFESFVSLLTSDGRFRTPPNTRIKETADESLEILHPPRSAINDTNKISKTKGRVPKPKPIPNTSNLSYQLRKVTFKSICLTK